MTHSAHKPPRLAGGILILLAGAVGVTLWRAMAHRPPPPDVYAVCLDCGITREEIDWLVETMRAANDDRDSLLAQFRETFKSGRDHELCRPCAEAVLDEAGK